MFFITGLGRGQGAKDVVEGDVDETVELFGRNVFEV